MPTRDEIAARLNQTFRTDLWPHHRLLIWDMFELSDLAGDDLVVGVERAKSLDREPPFAPLFKRYNSLEWGAENVTEMADLLVMYNVTHHCQDLDSLFTGAHELVKQGGRFYVYDAMLREIHQRPHHYFHMTPYGMRHLFESHGFEVIRERCTGSPGEASAYFIGSRHGGSGIMNSRLLADKDVVLSCSCLGRKL